MASPKVPGWARRCFPELERFPSEDQQREAWCIARLTVGSWPFWGGIPLTVFVLFGAFYACNVEPWISAWAFGSGEFVFRLGFYLLIGASGVAIPYLIHRRRLIRSLREQLCRIGVPICIACGYDLRGQTEPRCPVCGRAFDTKLLQKK